jgi:DNA-binding NtrC family response regulator
MRSHSQLMPRMPVMTAGEWRSFKRMAKKRRIFMNGRLVLLLTRDRKFQDLVARALSPEDGDTLHARDLSEALQIVSRRGRELDCAVVDFADGCHGLILLAALQTYYPELPVVVATSSDAYYASALLYANDVQACLAKPISATELELVFAELAPLEDEAGIGAGL